MATKGNLYCKDTAMINERFSQFSRKLRRINLDDISLLRNTLADFAQVYREHQAASGIDVANEAAAPCIREIALSPLLFQYAVSTWLTEIATIELAKRVVSRASVDQLKSLTPVSYTLSEMTAASAMLTAFRLCVMPATPAISLGWALSLQTSFQEDANLEDIRKAVDLLLKYHVEEYPWTTGRLLSSWVKEAGGDARAVDALAVLTDQEDWIAKQARLREFAMTPEMFSMFAGLSRNESREIHRLSRKKSIFAQLCSTHQFKYSNRTAVEFMAGGLVQESALEMSEYELEVELPQSERTDPVGGALRRKAMWKGMPQ